MSGVAATRARGPEHRVALRQGDFGLLYTEAKIEGLPVDVLLDTGSSAGLSLPRALLARAGLGGDPMREIWADTAGGRVKFRTTRGRVAVGGAEATVEIVENRGGDGLAVLGTDFLSAFDWSIDAERRELVLRPPRSLAAFVQAASPGECNWNELARRHLARSGA